MTCMKVNKNICLTTLMMTKKSQWMNLDSLLTLGAHAQRGLRYLVCVCVCVSVSVTQHLTFHVFIHATNDTNLLGGG